MGSDEDIQDCGPIEEDKDVSEIRQEPYTLPPGFEWDTLDITDPKVVCGDATLIFDWLIYLIQ